MRYAIQSVLALTLCASVQGQTPEPIFHAPFDGDAKAQRAGGAGEPLVAQNLAFAPGAAGQALAVSKDSLLEYPVAGNLVQESGTVTLWFKPNWQAAMMDDSKGSDWHCLFYERLADGKERIGSGTLWFWFWGPSLRGDLSDHADMYKTAGTQGLDQHTWAHFAFSWDKDRGSRLYINGLPVGSLTDGYSPLKLAKGGNYEALKNSFESFYVGSQGGMAKADGLIDEFKIFPRALTPEEVASDMAQVAKLRIDCLSSFLLATGKPAEIRWSVTNIATERADTGGTWRLIRPSGETVAQGNVASASLAPGERRESSAQVPALAKGQYKLIVQPSEGPFRSTTLWSLDPANEYLKPAGKLETSPVETIDFAKGVPPERLVVRGETRIAQLDGRSYFEAGPAKNNRFAVHVTLPEAGVPYLVEWDYPDDKLRTMEMLAHDAMNPGSDYAMQTGVFTGDEYPNTGKTLTHRSILWARVRDMAFIFMTARENAPAAVTELRISRINGGLPDAGVKPAQDVNGWTRSVAIHFEDPSLGYDFGITGQLMPHYEKTIDRLIAYMRFSGQNLLSYPAVWYHGRIGTAYQPRHHEDDFIGCILAKFEPHGLEFMPAINLQNIAVPDDLVINETTMSDGSLHSSPVMIFASGKPNPGGWHGTPPNFNPLHPAVQKYVNEQIDDLLNRYADRPAFKGIVLHLTKHTIPWFGSLEAGYNDYCIDAFEKDTGVRVPVDRKEALRGKLYHDWLMANARDQWVQWRCDQIAKWYRALADRISARRPDLKLSLYSYNPTVSDFADDERYGKPGFALAINCEGGIDPKLYQDADNIILSQTIYPSDYRWKEDHDARTRAMLVVDHLKPDAYALLDGAKFPWVNMHDRYFEDGIGGARWWWGKVEPLEAPWLKEMSWRVSVLNASDRYFLEHYIVPLRHHDVLGFSKGGFLIGTLGVEEKLAQFAREFRALPAVSFADVAGSTDMVKARQHTTQGSTFYYVVNTDRKPARVEPNTDGESRAPIELQPYELRAFSSETPLRSVRISGQ